MVQELNKKNIQELVEKSSRGIIIDVSASWCGPCIQMKPIFEQLSEELGAHYMFCSLNVDEERDLAIQYSVTSIPTFLFIRENKIIGREMGYIPKDNLKSKIEEYLG
jgi:thioredoxin 1